MCIIIDRAAGFEIPWEKFEPAVVNNPDGMGLMFKDDGGKLNVIRSPEQQDPEVLYRTVNEELLDVPLTLHLRYTTAGATNLRNAHPFPVLERTTDGVDLRMCHNGTIADYKPATGSDESDTRRFVREFVRPLFKRMCKVMEPEEILSDPLSMTILENMIPKTSCLSFRDGNDNTMIVNETGNGGAKEEGWWYSNTYSFRPAYRTPKTGSNSRYGVGYTLSKAPDGATSSSVVQRLGGTAEKFTKQQGVSIDEVLKMNDYALDKVLTDKDATKSLVQELLFTARAARMKVARLEKELADERGV